MHPPDCPSWEYSNHPERARVLPLRVSEVLSTLIQGGIDTLRLAVDSRDAHLHVFRELAPAGFDYYAGHYRGEAFRCLRFYQVRVPNDPRVGAAPSAVGYLMEELGMETRAGVLALDSARGLTPNERLYCIVAFACRVFTAFLTIHPFANGNGHAARFVTWSILGRYNHWPRRWPVEPRPPDPPYTELIVQCRNGDPVPLEKFILQSLIG